VITALISGLRCALCVVAWFSDPQTPSKDLTCECRAQHLERLAKERPKFRYDIRDVMEVLPTMTERDAPVVTAVAEGIREIFGREPDYVISPGTYDQKHVARIGHLHDCIAYGPGILDLAHRPDEWVGIDDMVESAKVMAIGMDALLRGAKG
jgi:succinyl-diaminopimelate desuccinylase